MHLCFTCFMSLILYKSSNWHRSNGPFTNIVLWHVHLVFQKLSHCCAGVRIGGRCDSNLGDVLSIETCLIGTNLNPQSLNCSWVVWQIRCSIRSVFLIISNMIYNRRSIILWWIWNGTYNITLGLGCTVCRIYRERKGPTRWQRTRASSSRGECIVHTRIMGQGWCCGGDWLNGTGASLTTTSTSLHSRHSLRIIALGPLRMQ